MEELEKLSGHFPATSVQIRAFTTPMRRIAVRRLYGHSDD
jgi:hypothetical protein